MGAPFQLASPSSRPSGKGVGATINSLTSVLLLRAQLQGYSGLLPADVPRALHWSNYSAKCIALIQVRGMPIDLELWNLVQENKATVIGELLRRFDPSHDCEDPIYTPEGKWSYARFERWLARSGVRAWPRLDSGMLDTGADAVGRFVSVSVTGTAGGATTSVAVLGGLNIIAAELDR